MLVRFKNPYFAAGPEFKRNDGQPIKGILYPSGIHEVPDDTPLPKSAEKLKRVDKSSINPLPIPKRGVNPLHEYDLDRAAGASEDAALKAAEVNRTRPTKRKPGRPKKYA